MNSHIEKAIADAPAGTSGYVVAPWSHDEVYGVAADWSQASSPVRFYGESGWSSTQYQVADFGHRPLPALELQLVEALRMSGETDEDGDEFASIASGLVTEAIQF